MTGMAEQGLLALPLVKEDTKLFALPLSKASNGNVTIRASWDGSADIDLHALLVNAQGVADQATFKHVLSTLNVERTINGKKEGSLPLNADGSFSSLDGAMWHSKDARDGNGVGDDEKIVLNVEAIKSKLPGYSVVIIASVYPQNGIDVISAGSNLKVSIEDASGLVLSSASFAATVNCTAVSLGTIVPNNDSDIVGFVNQVIEIAKPNTINSLFQSKFKVA